MVSKTLLAWLPSFLTSKSTKQTINSQVNIIEPPTTTGSPGSPTTALRESGVIPPPAHLSRSKTFTSTRRTSPRTGRVCKTNSNSTTSKSEARCTRGPTTRSQTKAAALATKDTAFLVMECTHHLCPVGAQPHPEGLYLHDGKQNGEVHGYFGASNPPPWLWDAYQKVLEGKGEADEMDFVNLRYFVEVHGREES